MTHKKVGIYRKYLEPVPVDSAGRKIPKANWPKKRRFCWVARWFSDGGKRHSRSFATKSQALSFAIKVQAQLQEARRYCRPRISLQQFCTEHLADLDPPPVTYVSMGRPFAEIIAYAREHAVNLIVMGTHGRGAIAHVLLGSTTEKVVRKAPCAVLTVRGPDHEFEMP